MAAPKNILANNNTFTSKLIDFKISAMSNFTSVKVKKCMDCWFDDDATFPRIEKFR